MPQKIQTFVNLTTNMNKVINKKKIPRYPDRATILGGPLYQEQYNFNILHDKPSHFKNNSERSSVNLRTM